MHGAIRRRWVVIAGVLVALAVAGAAFWWGFVPHWRPPLQDGEIYGVDVSHHQGEIAWTEVAEDGIEFAYIKATEGGDFLDPRFTTNWQDADRVGLDRGAYHFFTLCRPGSDQAGWFLQVVPPDPDALPPAVDLELAGNCAGRPDIEDVHAQLDDFLARVEQAWGRQVVLYVGDDWEARYPVRDRSDRLLWHRRFLRRPDLEGWWIWQLHGWADIDGICGGADLNVMRPPDEVDRGR